MNCNELKLLADTDVCIAYLVIGVIDAIGDNLVRICWEFVGVECSYCYYELIFKLLFD